MYIRFKKLHPMARKPFQAYNSVGCDVFPVESGEILPGRFGSIKLGFAAEFEDGHVALVQDRGSTGNRGLRSLAGVIDPDYRGEWIVWLFNAGTLPYNYSPEKACAQILFIQTKGLNDWDGSDSWASELTPSIREEKCLGSSDKKP